MALASQTKMTFAQRPALMQRVQKQCSVAPMARTRIVTSAISDVNMIVGGACICRTLPQIQSLPVARPQLA
jgi:hypothetical protein